MTIDPVNSFLTGLVKYLSFLFDYLINSIVIKSWRVLVPLGAILSDGNLNAWHFVCMHSSLQSFIYSNIQGGKYEY